MLSREQLSFFARNGFLQISGLIDNAVCSELIDITRQRFPAGWRHDDPSTWQGPASDACHTSPLDHRGGRLQFKIDELADRPIIAGSFGSDAIGGKLARSLIGHDIGPIKMRGLYSIFPLADEVRLPRFKEAHNEAHPSQLILLCYLQDVVTGGGGLLVWPGSHRAIYPVMGSKLEHVATPEYDETFWQWTVREPIELPGRCGDIVIIHHRLLHAPSVNRSDRIRYGFLCDYRCRDFASLCAQKPGADIWEDWPAMAALPRNVSEAPPDFELSPQTDSPPRREPAVHQLRRCADQISPSMKRKADASVLERMRQVGDYWLVLSDSALARGDSKLFPRGSDLTKAGVRLRVNGRRTASICKYDIIVPVHPAAGELRIDVKGLKSTGWLRIISTRLPFSRSELIFEQEIRPGNSRALIGLGDDSAAARISPSTGFSSPNLPLFARFGRLMGKRLADR